MPTQLNHTIIWCRDQRVSSAFLAGMLGLPEPKPFLHFMVVQLDNDVSLDFMEIESEFSPQHYAFLVGDEDFDNLLSRIHDQKLRHWADPARSVPDQINHHFGGRGVYFEDPNGHLLEAITRPYSDQGEKAER